MQYVWTIVLLTALTSVTGCNGEDSIDQGGKSLVEVDSDNDGIDDRLDCAPQDESRWQQLSYNFQDQDLDGHLTSLPKTQLVCSGALLPSTYLDSSIGYSVGDCDDSLATGVGSYRNVMLFKDQDQDNVGAGVGSNHCIGATQPKGYSLAASDCNDLDNNVYQLLNYSFRDEDRDNHLRVLPQSANICTGNNLPSTYLSTSEGKWLGDCDDSTATGGSIYRSINLFVNKDQDQLGAGESQTYCIGEVVPKQLATLGNDCNDGDAEKFQNLSYQYRDKDLDNHIVQLSQSAYVCSGTTLPSTYLASRVGKWLGDCDDDPVTGLNAHRSVRLFTDQDGDLFGKGEGQQICIGEKLPDNFSYSATDCNDNDKNIYQELAFNYRDADLDEHLFQLPKTETICSGQNLPATYLVATQGLPVGDCDDDPATGALTYQSKQLYVNDDLDQKGTGLIQQYCIGETIPTKLSVLGGDCDDENADVYQNLHYMYLDLDQDKHLVHLPKAESICSGDTLPNTHLISTNGWPVGDCDDSAATGLSGYRSVELFNDQDGDLVGAGEGQSYCIGEVIPDNFASIAGDCDDLDLTIYQNLSFSYRDKDGDGVLSSSAQAGSICAGDNLPSTYAATTNGWHLSDCDDNPDTGAEVYRSVNAFTDNDGDNWGVGENQRLCIGSVYPKNYSINSSDCDDNDPLKYTELEYNYRDEDDDYHVIQMAQTEKICTGQSLPDTYLASLNGRTVGDCDDSLETGAQVYRTVSLFTDSDGDKIGVGESQKQCIGSVIPDSYSTLNSDCEDSNAHFYEFLPGYTDTDGDGFGVGESIQVCAGKLMPIGFADNFLDCDDTNGDAWKNEMANYQDIDGDGYLSKMLAPVSMCVGEKLPNNYLKDKPLLVDCDDTIETGASVFRRVALFEDLDQDGYGNNKEVLSVQCLGASLPTGFAYYGGDMDDQDANVFEDESAAEEELNIILSY